MRSKIQAVCALLLICTSIQAREELTTLRGEAYDLNGETLLYTEHHQFEYADGKPTTSQVEYRTPQGEVFGRKTLDFSRSLTVPSYETRLHDGQYIEGLRYSDDAVVIYRSDDAGQSMDEKTLKLDDRSAADAGFNNLVLMHYDELLSGETVKFRFIAPNRQISVRFKAEFVGQREIEGLAVVDFKVAVASLLGLFVDPLRLSYDAQTRHLIEYRGLSNVRNAQGELYEVRIRYPELIRKPDTSE